MFFGYVFNGGWLKLVSEFTLLQGDWGNNDNDWQLKKLQHDSLKTSEKVVEVLRREAGNKSKAARALGIDRRKIYRLLEKFAISDAELTNARTQ